MTTIFGTTMNLLPAGDSHPTSAHEGDTYFNTTSNQMFTYIHSKWIEVGWCGSTPGKAPSWSKRESYSVFEHPEINAISIVFKEEPAIFDLGGIVGNKDWFGKMFSPLSKTHYVRHMDEVPFCRLVNQVVGRSALAAGMNVNENPTIRDFLESFIQSLYSKHPHALRLVEFDVTLEERSRHLAGLEMKTVPAIVLIYAQDPTIDRQSSDLSEK